MVSSFTVVPALRIEGGNQVSAAAKVSFAHKDNTITVHIPDSVVKDQSLNGVALEVVNDRLEVLYDVANNAPRVRLNTHLNVRDRRVNLTYRRDIKGNTSSLEGSLVVDDNNTAGVVYDLSNFDRPNHKSATLKWTHRQGDLEITPSFNLGTESAAVDALYALDLENTLRAKYCMNSNVGELTWTNSSGAGGGGDVKITARANLADTNSAKQVPTLLVEKSWTIDN